jgi:hypothetical protein
MQRRMIEAMCKPLCAFINNGMAEDKVLLVCRSFYGWYKSHPDYVTPQMVSDLESDVARYPPMPEYIRRIIFNNRKIKNPKSAIVLPPPIGHPVMQSKSVLESVNRKGVESKPNPKNDYPEPWAKVKNLKGELLRYEDANGKRIPQEMWPQ